MSARLIESLGTTEALDAVFDDESVLRAMLDFEVALARVQARAALIPTSAAEVIASAAEPENFDPHAIARDARESATFAIPLVSALTARVRTVDPSSAGFVHWGATSQDVSDTALALLLTRAHHVLASDDQWLHGSLTSLSDEHAKTVMLGRTLLQPAVPTTFGLKVAGWAAAVARGWARLSRAHHEAAILQCGGAAGTLASLGTAGAPLVRALADELHLPCPDAPWHTHRDRLAALVTSSGIFTGTLGKIARDVSLLMQDEVAECAERGGGSSAMPHKRNPAGSAIVIAAATRLPGLVAAFLTGMVQEHERAVGGWHAEWPTIVDAIRTTGAALAATVRIAEELTVFPDVMRANIEATHGRVFTERAMMLLAPAMGRETAHTLVQDAVAQSRSTGKSLSQALEDMAEVTRVLSADELSTLEEPHAYLGSAETFRRQLLDSAAAAMSEAE
jgi:3-carboxy-cis,cis-muconate cycloisomerase